MRDYHSLFSILVAPPILVLAAKDRNPQSMPAGGTRAGRAPIHDELLYPFDKGLGLRLVNITTSFCSQILLDTLSNYSRFCKLSE